MQNLQDFGGNTLSAASLRCKRRRILQEDNIIY